jgi:hypothetical protein
MAQFFEPSTDTDANFANSVAGQTNSYFLPSIYSKKVLNFFRKSAVVEAITNTDYEGEISAFGDSVRIVKEPVISVSSYTRGAATADTKLTDQETSLVIDTANAFRFKVDDIEKSMSHVNWKETAASAAAYALKDAYDTAILAAMVAGVSASAPDNVIGADAAAGTGGLGETTASVDLLGSDGTGVDALDLLARLARKLDDENTPDEGRFVVASPDFYEELSKTNSKLMSVDYNGGQGNVRNGLVSSGMLRGFSMYKSNNLPAQSTATGVLLGGHISATSTAQTIVSTETLRDPDSFGDICRGLHVFGSKVIRPEALVAAHYTID